ncbi:surface-adhesin E family protein [Burkholderia cenocepacia]|uniref:surface-adhesin E family protein n=1 Tax=Burkholderia cenocepacia TaxID=95486 RepID=UPI001B9E913E|nr:surface-adhesin E family protein [Burkholderia cenocepacia]MBR8097680.1 hypothetical protein [Burkholderia cenocepacia]MDI9683543.1 hypothetical protein [Burkholderia cenocepacia]HEP6427760.1 hypothetical protein [Burkholderia cenocepacia]
MKIHRLAGVICVAIALPANASDWQLLDSDQTGTAVYIDASSIVYYGTKAKAWAMYNLPNGQVVAGTYPPKTAQSLKILNVYDCAQRTSAIAQSVILDGQNGHGNVITSNVIPPSRMEFADAVPDSLGATVMARVCARRPEPKKPNM